MIFGLAWGVLGLGLYAVTVNAAADDKKAKDEKAPGAKAADDRTFVRKASEINLAEINLGNLALKRAGQDGVRKFAQHLVDDHTKANTKLNKVADAASMPVASEMDGKHKALFDKLASWSGDKFDQEFIQEMIKGHKEAIALFKAEADNGQDKALKEFASSTLSQLRNHLKTAEGLASKSGDKEKANTGK
jgi:putative membrane protein